MDEKSVQGLSTTEAQTLLKHHGKNSLAVKKKTSMLSLLFSQYKNFISLILLAAGSFSLISHHNLDAFFIFLVLILNGLFSFAQEFRAEKTLEKLKNLVIPQARVIRDGEEQELAASDIVPGDIIILREGDRIPADGKLLTNIDLEVDESIFTGESLPADKKKNDPLYSGCFIIQGRGHMQVEKTGMQTKLGEIAEQIKEIEKPKTPLADNLDHLGKRLAIIALILALLLIPIGIIQGREVQEMVLTSVSIGVAMIPEGLPLVVTVALAVGAYKMTRVKTIVRKMAAIETLGSTNIILTDKTGTLTQNNMSVKKQWIPDEKNMPFLIRAATVANTATLALKEDGGSQGMLGDKTDGALLLFAQEHIKDMDDYIQEGEMLHEEPFNSVTKTIQAKWKYKGKTYDFVRGAPESVLKLIGTKNKDEIEKKLKEMGEEALRVIAFAYKAHTDKNYTFLGFLGIYDPPRPEAEAAIRDAKRAGIRVVMVTGDNPITALSIAEEIGLAEEGDLVLTSDEVEKLTDQELLEKLSQIRIFARMKPEDKLRLVRLYKNKGYVVAVTGDGVNDALALSQANIGVAMGGTGTDVAKEASDVIITDDNIHTVIRAVEEGRGIFDNIAKVVVFLFATNLVEFLVIFVGILLGFPIPLTPTQVLWINLVGDGLPAMALATDMKRSNLLNLKPRNINEQILNKKRLAFIAKIVIPFGIFLLAVYGYLLGSVGATHAQFMLFNVLIAGEMIVIFIIRGGIFPINRFLFLTIGITLLLQALIIFNPVLKQFFV